MYTVVTLFKLMKKKSLSRQAKLKLEIAIRHRINAGRVAIKDQIPFFRRHFGQVSSDWKADASRVTFADIAISENLFACLKNDFADDDFCSEEMSTNASPIELSGDFSWVLDPQLRSKMVNNCATNYFLESGSLKKRSLDQSGLVCTAPGTI